MGNRVLVHGVPNTPAIWDGLIEELGEPVAAPCLPGFCAPCADGFGSTQDDYAEWLLRWLETRYADGGPIDIVGHDWGGLLTLRAASLRPDLIRSWTISGAAIDPDYRGHAIARIWNTPVLGEVAMAVTPPKLMEISFRQSGLPPDLARHEASAWKPSMRNAILALYRSANGLRFAGDWIERLAQLPRRGLVVWGAQDPFMPMSVALRFANTHGTDVHIESDAGHWAIAERPRAIAQALLAHWK